MMEFSLPYQLAMREQAPEMFNRLRRTGALSVHLKQKSAEAHQMYDQLAKDLPKLPGGGGHSGARRTTNRYREQVFGLLIEFPENDPKDDQIPGDQTPTFPPTA